ncbi:MAG: zinc-ribbon domain-containing protein [Coprobacillaceae bacterium]
MKVCPYCREDLPDDTIYCSHCGKPIEEVKQETVKPEKQTKKERAKVEQTKQLEPAQRNIWPSLGIILFLVGLVGFDGIIATIFNSMNMDYKIIFIISTFLYIGAVGCGVMALIKDHQSKKKGFAVNSNYPMAIAEIFISSYIILVNMQHVLLR